MDRGATIVLYEPGKLYQCMSVDESYKGGGDVLSNAIDPDPRNSVIHIGYACLTLSAIRQIYGQSLCKAELSHTADRFR